MPDGMPAKESLMQMGILVGAYCACCQCPSCKVRARDLQETPEEAPLSLLAYFVRSPVWLTPMHCFAACQ